MQKKLGLFYSSEPNSVNAMNRVRAICQQLGLELVEASVTNSNETQQVMASLIDKNIDVFFALPDNIIFASFETVNKMATEKKIPVVTSEAGLVARGAFIAYGADFYQWGHQAGVVAAATTEGLPDVSPVAGLGPQAHSPSRAVSTRRRCLRRSWRGFSSG